MSLFNLGKVMILLGTLLFVVGALMLLGARLGLGSLPGDIAWKRGNTSVYFPIVTSIVLSVVLTIVINIILRFLR